MGKQKNGIEKTLTFLLIALVAVSLSVVAVSAAPGNYQFITQPPPPSGVVPGGSSWGIAQTYPTLYEGFYEDGNARVISSDTPTLGLALQVH